MIRLRSGNMCVIGLSQGNIDLLRAGKPIKIMASDFGLESDVEIWVMWGETEAALCAELGVPADAVALAELALQRAKIRREKTKS